MAAALLILVLGGLLGLAVRGDLRSDARQHAQIGRLTRGETLVLGLDPEAVPENARLPLRFGLLQVGELRGLLDEYGRPFPSTRATADQQLVDMGFARARSDGSRDVACKPLTGPFLYEPPAKAPGLQYLWSPDAPVVVDVRRFGDDWVRLNESRPDEALALALAARGIVGTVGGSRQRRLPRWPTPVSLTSPTNLAGHSDGTRSGSVSPTC